MADNGYKNSGNRKNPGNKSDDLLNIKNDRAPAPDAKPPTPPKENSKWRMPVFPVRETLKKILVWSGLAIAGGTFLYSSAEIDKERPEVSLLSYQGLTTTLDRTLSNLGRLGGFAWDHTGRPLGHLLHAANPIEARRQPLPYAVVCVSQQHEEQLKAGDPRAVAYNNVVQDQLDREMHLLATVDAPFYRSKAYYNPERQAPAALFRIPAVAERFNAAAPSFVLDSPKPVSEWQIHSESGPCRDDETFHTAPLPRLDAK